MGNEIMTSDEKQVLVLEHRDALVVDFSWAPVEVKIQVSLFLLNKQGQFPTSEYLLLPGGNSAYGNFVRLLTWADSELGNAQVQFHLASVPDDVHQVRAVLAVLEPSATLIDVTLVEAHAWDSQTGETDGRFSLGPCGITKTFVILELRREAQGWELHECSEGKVEALHDLANKIGVSK